MPTIVENTKNILKNSSEIGHGSFCLVTISSIFPPQNFLNEFLSLGSDPTHQDAQSPEWVPFRLNEIEYLEILEWWQSKYPNSKVDGLGKSSWNDWLFEIIHVLPEQLGDTDISTTK